MTISTIAAPGSGGNVYTDYLVIAAFISLGVAVLVPMVLRRGDTFERRCYWGGTFGAAISALAAAVPDWVGGMSFACVTVFGMWLPAYFTSGELIKIRGRVYNFHIQRANRKAKAVSSSAAGHESPDDYPDVYNGDTTPTKMWWLVVVCIALLTFFIVISNNSEGRWMQISSIAFFVMFAVAFGYVADGSYGYPIARRQYAQFVLASIISAGTFALLYLPAYYLGRQWPLRPSMSTERQAPPRYWEK